MGVNLVTRKDHDALIAHSGTMSARQPTLGESHRDLSKGVALGGFVEAPSVLMLTVTRRISQAIEAGPNEAGVLVDTARVITNSSWVDHEKSIQRDYRGCIPMSVPRRGIK